MACTACHALEQGTVQGALYASASLGQAVGPLLIGNWLFVAFTRRENGWPYFPEVGRRLAVSTPVLNAPAVSALATRV